MYGNRMPNPEVADNQSHESGCFTFTSINTQLPPRNESHLALLPHLDLLTPSRLAVASVFHREVSLIEHEDRGEH